MAIKRLKRPRDPVQRAKLIGDIATGRVAEHKPSVEEKAAHEVSRRAGLKGGNARAVSLSSKRKTEIARKAAATRWGKAVTAKD